MSNIHLIKQVRKHDDEYYTQYKDIENELKNYEQYFRDKIVYCNCDSASSNFVKYFQNNFDRLGLKKLNYSSCDFRSDKSIYTLMHSDIICTNPPFSYIKDFVDILMKYKKQFLCIGTRHLIGYSGYFSYFKNYDFWVSASRSNNSSHFLDINGIEKIINCYWYTNIGSYPKREFIVTGQIYDKEKYPSYYNCVAIHVDSVKSIPDDYYGLMGVPENFIEHLNPKQFDLMYSQYDIPLTKNRKSYKSRNKIVYIEDGKEVLSFDYTLNLGKKGNAPCYFKDGKLIFPFQRIFIKRKPHSKQTLQG